jgi:hypothetical protein
MKQYLLGMHQPDSEPPPSEVLGPIMARVNALTAEMKAAGVWVFAAGLERPGASTVVRARGDDVLVTDGPYTEGKEHLGGFTVIKVADLDEALAWARKLAAILPLPIEVRPVKEKI